MQDRRQKKRRWLQFSLRGFFILTTALVVWLAWFTHRVNDQKEAVSILRANGDSYEYDTDESFSDPSMLREITINSLGRGFLDTVTFVETDNPDLSFVASYMG